MTHPASDSASNESATVVPGAPAAAQDSHRPRIVAITRAFPYPPGEQFVGPEAPFWGRDDAEVIVLPARIEGEPWHELPDGVRVDPALANPPRSLVQRYRAKALRSPLLAGELAFLVRHGRLSRASAIESVRAVSGALMVADQLADWTRDNGPIDVVYGYWYDVWPMGAQLLRDRSRGRAVRHVVSRVHRYDLYEERNPGGYQGLKRRLAPRLDAILPIARMGADYVHRVYGVPERLVRFSPLGVRLPTQLATPSPAGELHVMSTALVSHVKRVDRLADALVRLASDHPELQVHWTHLGGGDLLPDIRRRVDEPALANLHPTFPGTVDNEAVRRHLATEPVDVFVNTSESEGVPVSIMEAMAFGVPALAPDVGGVGELVPSGGPGGQLLSASPDADEVAAALWQWHERAKDAEQRRAAHGIVAANYDEQRNYRGLFDDLVALARRPYATPLA